MQAAGTASQAPSPQALLLPLARAPGMAPQALVLLLAQVQRLALVQRQLASPLVLAAHAPAAAAG